MFGLESMFGEISGVISSLMTIFAFSAFLWKPCRKKIIDFLVTALKVEEIDDKLDRHMKDDETKKKLYERLDVELHKLENEVEQFIENDKASKKIYREAHLVEIREEIIQIYNKFSEQHYIPIYEKENLIKRYEVYEKLGGNSFVHDIFNDLMALPTSPPQSTDP